LSLQDCLKKVAMSRTDREKLNSMASSAVKDGMTPEDAAAAESTVINQFMENVDSDLDAIATQAEAQGVTVSKRDDKKIEDGLKLEEQKLLKEQNAKLGLFSPVERAVLTMKLPAWDSTKKNPEGKALGSNIYANIRKASGVKQEELHWLGLQEILEVDPKAKYTREETASIIQAIELNVIETVAGDPKPQDIDITDEVEIYHNEPFQYDIEMVEEALIDHAVNGLKQQFRGGDLIIAQEHLPFGISIDMGTEYSKWVIANVDKVFEVFKNKDNKLLTDEEIFQLEKYFAETDSNTRKKVALEQSVRLSELNPLGWEFYNNGQVQALAIDHLSNFIGSAVRGGMEIYRDRDNDTHTLEVIRRNQGESNSFLLGNDESGYGHFFGSAAGVHGFMIESGDTLSHNEGFVRLEDAGRDEDAREAGYLNHQDAIESQMDGEFEHSVSTPVEERAKWGSSNYNVNHPDLNYNEDTNYREIKIKMPDLTTSAGERFTNTVHFDDENIITFLRTNDRTDMGGLSGVSLHIEEQQSDLHQKGRQVGYSERSLTDLAEAKSQISSEMDSLSRTLFETQEVTDKDGEKYILTERFDEGIIEESFLSAMNTYVEMYSKHQDKGDLDAWLIRSSAFHQVLSDRHKKSNGKSFTVFAELFASNPKIAEQLIDLHNQRAIIEAQQKKEIKAVPDAPFKKTEAWIDLGLKRALLTAIAEGKDHLTWNNAASVASTWSKEYLEMYSNQYNKLMPARIKKITGITPTNIAFDGDPAHTYSKPSFEDSIIIENDYWAGNQGQYVISIKRHGLGAYGYEKIQGTDTYATRVKFDTREEAEAVGRKLYERIPAETDAGFWHIPITEELRNKVMNQGLSLFQPDKDMGKSLTKKDERDAKLVLLPNTLTDNYHDNYDRIVAEAAIVNPDDFIGATFAPTLADLTGGGFLFTGIDSSQVDYPTEMQGGQSFPMLESYHNGKIVWAVNDVGGVTKLQKSDYIIVSAMAADTHRSNASVMEALFSTLEAYIRDGRIDKDGQKELTQLIKHGNKAKATMKELGYKLSWKSDKTIQKFLEDIPPKKVPVAVRKTIDESAWIGYETSGKKHKPLSAEDKATLTEALRDFMSDKTFEQFPSFNNRSELHKWISSLTFHNRKVLADTLATKTAQNLGSPNVNKVLRETIDKSVAGYAYGDAMLIIKVDKGKDAQVELGDKTGTKKHRSYKYGVTGSVVGKFHKPVGMETMFPDWAKSRRDKNASIPHGKRSFMLALPEQKMTKEMADTINSLEYNAIQTPKQARLAQDFKRSNWRSSLLTKDAQKKETGKEGFSAADFIHALKSSPSSSTLTIPNSKLINREINAARKGVVPDYKEDKDGNVVNTGLSTRIFNLGQSEVYFALSSGYNYNREYGIDLEAAGLSENEVAINGVINNELGAKGIAAPAVMLKAIEEGATVLDAYAVKSKDYKDGFLPSLYAEYGFEVAATVPFDPEYHKDVNELNDLKRTWAADGWKESDGFPDIVIMKWSGTNEQRKGLQKRWLQSVKDGTDFSTTESIESEARELADEWNSETDPEARVRERNARHDKGSVQTGSRIPSSDRLRAILGELDSLTPAERINLNLEEGNLFYQPNEQDKNNARGNILFKDDKAIITLFEKADLSTFLHESGHLFLEMERQLSDPENLTEDQQKILQWLGVNSFDEIGVEHHEMWARGFEKYLYEGKAPSENLRSAFSAFSNWLTQVYKGVVSKLNVQLNDDIRGVMDRMLASKEEIAEARSSKDYRNLFLNVKTAGREATADDQATVLTEKEMETYQKKVRQDAEKADETLRTKLFNELKRTKTKLWKSETAQLKKEIKAELIENDPVYSSRDKMRKPIVDDNPDTKMNSAAVRDFFDGKIPIEYAKMVHEDSTMNIDEMAERHGFADGATMFADLSEAPPLNDRVKEMAEDEMHKRHGDMLNDGTLQQEAEAAAHHEGRAEFLLYELRLLNRQLKRKPAIDKRQLKEEARLFVERTPYDKLVPSKFRRAEVKYAKEAQKAVDKGDTKAAIEAKTLQAANFYLYRAATEAKMKAERVSAKLKRMQSRDYSKSMNPEYIARMKQLLIAYDFRRSVKDAPEAALDKVKAIALWAIEQQTDSFEIFPYDNNIRQIMMALDPAIPAADKPPMPEHIRSYKEMPLNELLGISDMADHLRFVGGKNYDEVKEQKLANHQTIADDIRATTHIGSPTHSDQMKDAMGRNVNDYITTALTNPENLVRYLDGDERGTAYERIKRPIDDAISNKLLPMQEQANADMVDIYEESFNEQELQEMNKKTKVNGLNRSFTKWEMISLALNWGNDSSRQAVIDSKVDGTLEYPRGEDDVMAVINNLTKKEWDFVKKVWAYNDSYWKQLSDLEYKRKGVRPMKVQPTSFMTKFGEMEGGYHPLSYDPKTSLNVSEEDLRDSINSVSMGRFTKAQTPDGMLQERQGSGGRPVLLDMSVWHRHITGNIQLIAMSDAINEVQELLSSKPFRDMMTETRNISTYKALDVWLKDIAIGEQVGGDIVSRWLRGIRTGFSAMAIGWNFSTVLMQPLGLFTTMPVIGYGNTVWALSQFARRPFEMIGYMQDNSNFMKHRGESFNKDLMDTVNAMKQDPTKGSKVVPRWVAKSLFKPIAFVQRMVDAISWHGAYRNSLGRNPDFTEADHISEADNMVRRSQSSGDFSDRTAVERGSLSTSIRQQEFVRIFTSLGGYFFNKGNIMVEFTRKANKEGVANKVRYVRDIMTMLAAEAIMVGVIKGTIEGLGDDEEEDSLPKWIAKETAKSAAGSYPLIREMGSEISGFRGGSTMRTFYEVGGKAFNAFGDVFAAPFDDDVELGRKQVKAINDLGGIMFKYPSKAMNRFGESFYDDVIEGEDVDLMDYLMWTKDKEDK